MSDAAGSRGEGVAVLGRTVRCVGEFDVANSASLRAGFAEAARSGPGYAIDLTGVTFLDSSALSALFEAAEHAPVVLVAAGSLMERLAGTIGLTSVVEVRSVPA
ncbi:MAG: STAS domain-containing protein [Sporichthyaceae bacterium]